MKKQLILVFILFCNSMINAQKSNESSDDLYKKGVEFFNNNDFQNAKSAFEQSFKLNPNFNAYGMYVIITLSSKHSSGLSENNKTVPFTLKLKELNKIKNGYFFNVVNDSYLQLEKQKLNTNRDDRIQIVESNIKKNIDKKYIENPKDFSANLNKGFSVIGFFPEVYKSKLDNSYQILPNGRSMEFYQSNKYFDNITKIRPESETGYLFKGFTNYEGGVSDLNYVLKLNPKNVLANMFLADLLDKVDCSGRVNHLARVFEVKPNEVVESIKIDGSELDVLFYYALYYKSIVESSQSGTEIEYVLSKLLFEKKYSELDILCNKLISQQSTNRKIDKEKWLFYKGVANFTSGSFGIALEDFDTLIKMNPSISDAFGMRGAVKTLSNDYELAILDLNKAIELEPNDGYMYFYRGIVNKKLGKIDESCSDFIKSRELGYENQRLMFFFENCK